MARSLAMNCDALIYFVLNSSTWTTVIHVNSFFKNFAVLNNVKFENLSASLQDYCNTLYKVNGISHANIGISLPLLNPDWHELWKQEKWSSSAPPSGMFYRPQWALQGVKLTGVMSIFTSKKVWKFLIKIQRTKSDPKKYRGWKVPSLMPIRVNRVLHFVPSFKQALNKKWPLRKTNLHFCIFI